MYCEFTKYDFYIFVFTFDNVENVIARITHFHQIIRNFFHPRKSGIIIYLIVVRARRLEIILSSQWQPFSAEDSICWRVQSKRNFQFSLRIYWWQRIKIRGSAIAKTSYDTAHGFQNFVTIECDDRSFSVQISERLFLRRAVNQFCWLGLTWSMYYGRSVKRLNLEIKRIEIALSSTTWSVTWPSIFGRRPHVLGPWPMTGENSKALDMFLSTIRPWLLDWIVC